MNKDEMKIQELEQKIKDKDDLIKVLSQGGGICDICETNTAKELSEVHKELTQRTADLAVERKINDEISEDLRLAKQFIDWLLITFDLTNYNWLEDQNEISTIIRSHKVVSSSITQLQEKLNILDSVGDTEENMRSFIESIRYIIDDYTQYIQEVLKNGN